MKRIITIFVCTLGFFYFLPAYAQVSPERILNAAQEPENWLLYGGDYDSQRHTDLTEITRQNADELELKWVWQNRAPDGASQKFEATPLVVEGVLYTVGAPNNVIAVDAVT
jgi:glucose dehydrogenase